MRNLLSTLVLVLLFVSCEKNTEIPGEGPQVTTDFRIELNEENVTPYSVQFCIYPEDKEGVFYYDIVSASRISSVDVQQIKREIEESAQSLADMTGSSYEDMLAYLLYKGDQVDIYSGTGYLPDKEYCIYAFAWDDPEAELTTCEFSTKEATPSSESMNISFENVTEYSMTVKCEPSAGVDVFYYYFAETATVDAMMAIMEDEYAYLSYYAMNVSVEYQGSQNIAQQALKADTDYTAVVMCVDESGNRFLAMASQATSASSDVPRVESELFELLLGEWTGVQMVTDLYNPAQETRFDVTIVAGVDDYDYDYRANNQLVALVDGWCDIAYYGVTSLAEQEIEEPELKYGPKWLLDIAEGDVVTVDGMARYSVMGWFFFGDTYMLSAKPDGSQIYTDSNFDVTISDDYNTITISSPAALGEAYPAIAYQFSGYGWMGYYYGASDIVLIRK